MKLAEMEVVPVHVTENLQSDVTPGVVVRLHTDDGTVGVGETVASAKYLGDTQAHVLANLEAHWKNIRGEDPLDVARLHNLMTTPYTYNAAETAIDMAVYDVLGKAMGEPVYRLFERGHRTEVEMLAHVGSGSIRRARYPERRTGRQLPRFAGIGVDPQNPEGERDIHQAIDHAERFVEAGYTGLEVKVGGDPRGAEEIRRRVEFVEGILDAVGEGITLNFDFNASWQHPSTVISALKGVARERRSFTLEEPISIENPEGLLRIREALNLPILADESATSPEAVMRLAKLDAVDAVTIKPSRVGGVYPSLRMIDIAEAAGMDVKVDTTPLTKITDTVAAHLATYQEYPYPAGLLDGHQWFKERPFADTGITYEDGRARVPDAPGWGIDLSEEELDSLQYAETEVYS